jgi:GTP-binding protein EngB required for normal cell division
MPEEYLNSNHARRLSVTCRHIDKLLADMEQAMSVASSRNAFPDCLPDITPTQRRVIDDYIARLRAQLTRVLDGQGIGRPRPFIPASRSLHTSLTFIAIAAEELQPKYMSGYGAVPPSVAVELNGIAGELLSLTRQLDQYITCGTRENLQARLLRLGQTGDEIVLLQQLENIINEQGLVEFRSQLSMILDRLEDNTFEIAVFGRVSSGKSSLLNAALETDALPVGVTPVTAVPTRIAYGIRPCVRVWLANRPPERVEVSRLSEFVAEQSNPGNEKLVTRIVLQIPSPRLRDGVVFVDTPGLGSLAARGAAETLAYLPRCDQGFVLIDAGSTITPDDLRTIQLLYEAGIPASVLLSKADLLPADDLSRMTEYVRKQISTELALETSVCAVSALAANGDLLSRWFEESIEPLYKQRLSLKMPSIRRKIGMLRESMAATLNTRLRLPSGAMLLAVDDLRGVESRLRQASGRLQEGRSALRRIADKIGELSPAALKTAASVLVDRWIHPAGNSDTERAVVDAVNQTVQTKVKVLHTLLSSLVAELYDSLLSSANMLHLSGKPLAEDFSDLLRETPAFDLGHVTLEIERPQFAMFFGHEFVRRRTAERLARSIGLQVSRSLSVYRQLAYDWLETTLGEIQRQFDAYATSYRAQVQRTIDSPDVSNGQEQTIRQALEKLQWNDNEGTVRLDSSGIGSGKRAAKSERSPRWSSI